MTGADAAMAEGGTTPACSGTVVAGGGGGVPVTTSGGFSSGVDAVIDKDLTSASLAIDLEAATLALLTDVDAVRRTIAAAKAA